MPFSEILMMAAQNIRANLLRSVLTLLIIALGIMALVGILTSIDSIASSLNDNFSGLGANSFTIDQKWEEVKTRRGGRVEKMSDPIRYRDVVEFKERFEFPAKVSTSVWGTNFATVKFGEESTNPNVKFMGIDENYLASKGLDIAHGRNFSRAEVESGTPKVIVGIEIVKKLFKGKSEKALDQIVIVGNERYRVVGILAEKGASMGSNNDRAVFAPLLNVKAIYATEDTNYDLIISVNNATNMDPAVSAATGLFRQIRNLRPGEEDDFEIFKSDHLASILKENTVTLQISAIVIGLMTLLGAAIGLMNIMLVSVTERTREIGIYKALGATKRNILIQFLLEAILICLLGGLVGIFLGIIIGNAVSLMMGGKFLIPWAWMLLGFTLCVIVGIISGLYPATKAAGLDPIEALRYE